eukprot:12317065-Alexandrium_andersonii.AAC.1
MPPTSFALCLRRGQRLERRGLRSWRCSPHLAPRQWPRVSPGMGSSRQEPWTFARVREDSRGTLISLAT